MIIERTSGLVTIVRPDVTGVLREEMDKAIADGDSPDIDLSSLGWARLTNRILKFGDWPSPLESADRVPKPLPIDLNTEEIPATVTVDGGTAVVAGTAEPSLGDDRPPMLIGRPS